MPIKLAFKRHPAKGKYVADQGVEDVATDPVERAVQRAEQIDDVERRRKQVGREAAAERLRDRIAHTQIEHIAIEGVKPNPRNAKKHPEKQVTLLAANIEQFGFTQPLVVDEDDVLMVGHGRLQAAKRLGLRTVPVVRLTNLSSTEKRAFALADNKIATLGEDDLEVLGEELKFLNDPKLDLDFDVGIIGFDTVEIDQLVGVNQPEQTRRDPADELVPIDPNVPAVTRLGDLWECGVNRLLCGSALETASYRVLMNGAAADIVFTDPPWNVPNAGHVTKREGVREFAMAAGEMTVEQFTNFLHTAAGQINSFCRAGAVCYLCTDWRHLRELLDAAKPLFGDPKNLIVWAKTNAGMGSFYRSQHGLILPFVVPGAAPANNFGLGGKGRYRSNLWRYPGFNGFGRDRDETLAMHPTVKPVAMIADALMDCSNRGDIVLDPFAGSGTSLIAAERTARRARLMEIDPIYCDVIVQRWQAFTGEAARLAESGETFDEVRGQRQGGSHDQETK